MDHAWIGILAGMIALGINKPPNLQSALTDMARLNAHDHGWHGKRRQIQPACATGVPILGLPAMVALAVLAWKFLPAALLACAGVCGLLVFVAIRAAFFHHLDKRPGWHLAGLCINWAIEMGSIGNICDGARRRLRVRT